MRQVSQISPMASTSASSTSFATTVLAGRWKSLRAAGRGDLADDVAAVQPVKEQPGQHRALGGTDPEHLRRPGGIPPARRGNGFQITVTGGTAEHRERRGGVALTEAGHPLAAVTAAGDPPPGAVLLTELGEPFVLDGPAAAHAFQYPAHPRNELGVGGAGRGQLDFGGLECLGGTVRSSVSATSTQATALPVDSRVRPTPERSPNSSRMSSNSRRRTRLRVLTATAAWFQNGAKASRSASSGGSSRYRCARSLPAASINRCDNESRSASPAASAWRTTVARSVRANGTG